MNLDYLVEVGRTLLYPALAVTWLADALLLLLYYANVLRHRLTLAAILAYLTFFVSYALLSLVTGLSPLIKDSDVILPWLVLTRIVQWIGAIGIGFETWRRLRENTRK